MTGEKPSATAFVVAASIAFLGRDRKLCALVPPGAAEACAWFVEACSPRGDNLLRAMNQGWLRTLVHGIERLALPGILLHYLLRKRYLEDVTRAALKAGFRQVVILGGGFDSLALRLHREFPHVCFIEIDHPSTQHVKRRALEGRVALGSNLGFLPVDFARQNWEKSVRSCPLYNSRARSLFIMEGVLMYLSVRDVDRTFRFIREHGGGKSRFAFTFMEPRAGGTVDFRNCNAAVALWLRRVGEPFDWGIRRRDLPGFLESRGFRHRELATPDTFRRLYLDPERFGTRSLAEGEYVCIADTA